MGEGEGEMTEDPFIAKASWEPKDDDKLRALAVLGKGVATIADLLGRSQTAVRGRAFNLELIYDVWRKGTDPTVPRRCN